MGWLRKLGRKGRDPDEIEPLRAVPEPSSKKLSAVLIEFAKPLIDTLDDDDVEGAIGFAVFCWNIALSPEDEQNRQRRNLVKEMAKRAPHLSGDFETWSKRLLERKNTLFAHDRRVITDYTLQDEGDSHHLVVLSTLASDSPRR